MNFLGENLEEKFSESAGKSWKGIAQSVFLKPVGGDFIKPLATAADACHGNKGVFSHVVECVVAAKSDGRFFSVQKDG